MKNKFKKKIPGFSLIEAAFFLLIAGVAASLAFPILTSSQRLQRHQVTQTHQDHLFHALASYVLRNNCLPMPSLPSLGGKKGEENTVCEGGEKGACMGIIPYQELGIPESMSKDGHGYWFSYAVIKSLLSPRSGLNEGEKGEKTNLMGEYFCQITPPGLKVSSLSGSPVLTEGRQDDFVAVVLISHGAKGRGAFHINKDSRLPTLHEKEEQNIKKDATFVLRSLQDEHTDFHHQVYWVTRNHLMALYAQHPCQPPLQEERKNQILPPVLSKGEENQGTLF